MRVLAHINADRQEKHEQGSLGKKVPGMDTAEQNSWAFAACTSLEG